MRLFWFAVDSILLVPVLLFVGVVWFSVTAWVVLKLAWAAVKEVWR